MTWTEMEAHRKWLHAFNWWHQSGKTDRIQDNLDEGVPLSPENSKFLNAIQAGKIRALSGKQAGLYRFRNNVIDNKIRDLRSREYNRQQILEHLKSVELLPKHAKISSIHMRLDSKRRPDCRAQHQVTIDQFLKLYRIHSRI